MDSDSALKILLSLFVLWLGSIVFLIWDGCSTLPGHCHWYHSTLVRAQIRSVNVQSTAKIRCGVDATECFQGIVKMQFVRGGQNETCKVVIVDRESVSSHAQHALSPYDIGDAQEVYLVSSNKNYCFFTHDYKHRTSKAVLEFLAVVVLVMPCFIKCCCRPKVSAISSVSFDERPMASRRTAPWAAGRYSVRAVEDEVELRNLLPWS